MRTLQELASEGILFKDHESELIKQQLVSTIKDASQKKTVGRQLVQVIPLREGSSLDWDKADKDSMIVREIGEGANSRLTHETYTKININPKKYGGTVKITEEMIEDSNFPLIERMLKQAGREMAIKEDTLIFNSFKDATDGFIQNADHDLTSQGTEYGIADVTLGMKEIEEQDYNPNVQILHPTQIQELRLIDTFVEADKVGNRRTFETGFVGKIFGLDTVKSTIVDANEVFIIDSLEAGSLVIRRPLTIKKFDNPMQDIIGASFTQRMAARVIEERAGVRITIQ